MTEDDAIERAKGIVGVVVACWLLGLGLFAITALALRLVL